MLNPGFRSSLASLWFRLITLGIVAFVFAEGLFLAPARVQGSSRHLSAREVIFEVEMRVIFAALAGIAFGMLRAVIFSRFPNLPRQATT
jgi:hypothetical protein